MGRSLVRECRYSLAGPSGLNTRYRVYGGLAAAAFVVALVSSLVIWAQLRTDDANELRRQAQETVEDLHVVRDALQGTEAPDQQIGRANPVPQVKAVESSIQRLEAADLDTASRALLASIVLALPVDQRISPDGRAETVRPVNALMADLTDLQQRQSALVAARESTLHTNLQTLFAAVCSIVALVTGQLLVIGWILASKVRARLQLLVHQETRHLLSVQENLNGQLLAGNARLRQSEESLEVTLNSIGDAVLATDAQARITRLNPVAEQLTGWTQAESLGRPVDDVFRIIKKDTREVAVVPVMATLAQGTIQGLANHTVLIARDGRECDIADSCAAIRDHDGQVVGAVLVFRNVSLEYAAQQAIRDSTAQIQAILNTVVDGIVTLDAGNDQIETVNPAAERMFGYSAAELHGQGFRLLIPELDQGQSKVALDYYRAGDDARSNGLGREVIGHRKDGSVFPLEMAVSEMWLNGKRFFTGMLRDITARKQIEDEGRKLEQRLRDQHFYVRSLIESNVDAMMTSDPSGTISDVNKQMEMLTECTRDELIGAPFKNYFTDPLRAEAAIQRVLTENKVTDYELVAQSRTGRTTDVSCNAITYYDRDRVLQGVFASVRDITDRKQFERILLDGNLELERAKSMAESANLAKSEFLSSMSHELRTPLSAILGFAQLIDIGVPLPTPAQKRSVDQILKAGWYLLELINEVLDLALVESGNLLLSMEPIQLSEVMQVCEDMIQPQAQKLGIGVSFQSNGEPNSDPLYVQADRIRLKQILINLLSNAIKYNRPGGSVVVDCMRRPDNRLRIQVRDSGAGIAEEKLQQLFQPFNRLGQESGGVEGTGIGLVVSKRLVELMDGTIGAESSVGSGSVFWIELALAQQPGLDIAADPAPVQRDTSIATTTMTRQLLYVEDNPANLMLIEDLVTRRQDVRLLTARTGDTGVDIARALLPDVILMDINLPGISGVKALQILLSDPLTAHIPVIALSANAMPSDIQRGLEAGFYRYLTKPIKVLEFLSTLDEALVLALERKSARITEPLDTVSC